MNNRILIVEDDIDIRDALVELLREEGYQADAVANGLEALEYIRAVEVPGLILLDIMMPVMDGWAFRAAQLADPSMADIPVVLLSGDGELSRKASALRVSGHIPKPFDLAQVLEPIQRFCR